MASLAELSLAPDFLIILFLRLKFYLNNVLMHLFYLFILILDLFLHRFDLNCFTLDTFILLMASFFTQFVFLKHFGSCNLLIFQLGAEFLNFTFLLVYLFLHFSLPLFFDIIHLPERFLFMLSRFCGIFEQFAQLGNFIEHAVFFAFLTAHLQFQVVYLLFLFLNLGWAFLTLNEILGQFDLFLKLTLHFFSDLDLLTFVGCQKLWIYCHSGCFSQLCVKNILLLLEFLFELSLFFFNFCL